MMDLFQQPTLAMSIVALGFLGPCVRALFAVLGGVGRPDV